MYKINRLQGCVVQHGNIANSLFFYNFISLFTRLLWASLGPCCLAPTFCSSSEQGILLFVVHGLLLAGGFSCCKTQALATRASVAAAHNLGSYSSRILKYWLRSGDTWLSCSMESSRISNLTCVLCIGRHIPIHCANQGTPSQYFITINET